MAVNNSTRDELYHIFREITDLYTQLDDTYRQKSFSEAAHKIKTYKGDILQDYLKKKIPKIGKTSKDIITEYLQTGQVQRLLDLRAQVITSNINEQEEEENVQHNHDPYKQDILAMFEQVHGIGKVTALNLYNKGYRSLDDIWDDLTPTQQIGVKWYEHLQERIQRDEADMIIQVIEEVFSQLDPNLVWLPCGSYRRGAPTMGDLDILIQQTDDYNLHDFVNALTEAGLLVDHLAQGKVKYLGVCRLSDDYNAHRIDLMIVPSENWSYATLYFTGSQNLNVLMRDKAISLGLRLNEYRLIDEAGTSYLADTEEDVFNYLDIPYLAPEKRSI